MHDFGVLIWIILVLIGVVSSIRKNAQRARSQAPPRQAAPPPRPVPVPPPVPAPQPVPMGLHRLLVTASGPVVPAQPIAPAAGMPGPPVIPVAAPRPSPVVAPAQPVHAPVGTGAIRGMFGGGGATLVRAIVAAEVLGPPRAFGEQTSWSQRRSEPSI